MKTFIPLELSHIGKPFFVRFRSIKLAIQKVFCKILWVFRLPCTAMIGVFNSGFDVPSPTNSQYSLIIDVNVVVVGQVISDAPIPFVRILYVDLLTDADRGAAAYMPWAMDRCAVASVIAYF